MVALELASIHWARSDARPLSRRVDANIVYSGAYKLGFLKSNARMRVG